MPLRRLADKRHELELVTPNQGKRPLNPRQHEFRRNPTCLSLLTPFTPLPHRLSLPRLTLLAQHTILSRPSCRPLPLNPNPAPLARAPLRQKRNHPLVHEPRNPRTRPTIDDRHILPVPDPQQRLHLDRTHRICPVCRGPRGCPLPDSPPEERVVRPSTFSTASSIRKRTRDEERFPLGVARVRPAPVPAPSRASRASRALRSRSL